MPEAAVARKSEIGLSFRAHLTALTAGLLKSGSTPKKLVIFSR